MRIALAQMAPVWLKRTATLNKMLDFVDQAANAGAELVVFGEALLPGYPFWLSATAASAFNDPRQKRLYAHYLEAACSLPTWNGQQYAPGRASDKSGETHGGDLSPLCLYARQRGIAIVLGCIERAADRGGHSCYCSLVYIDAQGVIQNIHRKLQPTYEERLCWAAGDGHGLRTFPIGGFTVGGLNCWENWMPLPRAALHGQGENLHLALWPGNQRNTEILTRFLAREGRSYCVSVSGLMRKADIPTDTPLYDFICENFPEQVADGGSCLAHPDGSWLFEPIVDQEGVFTAELDLQQVWQERQNFDPLGHYSRPDVTQLTVNRKRQTTVTFEE